MWGLPARFACVGKGKQCLSALRNCMFQFGAVSKSAKRGGLSLCNICFFLNPEPVILHVPEEPLYFIDVHGQSLGNTTAVHRLHSRNKEKNKWGIDLLKFAFMQRFHRGRTVCRVKPRPRSQPHFFLPIPPLQNDPPFIAFFFSIFSRKQQRLELVKVDVPGREKTKTGDPLFQHGFT